MFPTQINNQMVFLQDAGGSRGFCLLLYANHDEKSHLYRYDLRAALTHIKCMLVCTSVRFFVLVD